MKKLILCALPVVAFSVLAFAASPGTGVTKLNESPLYQVSQTNTITPADRQFIKEQIARAYNLDPHNIPAGMQFEMLKTADGVEIFKREIDIIDFEEVIWRDNAISVNPYGESVANVLRRYE